MRTIHSGAVGQLFLRDPLGLADLLDSRRDDAFDLILQPTSLGPRVAIKHGA